MSLFQNIKNFISTTTFVSKLKKYLCLFCFRSKNRSLKKNLEFKGNMYWESQKGPYCPNCYYKEDLPPVHLMGTRINEMYECPVCRGRFTSAGKIKLKQNERLQRRLKW